MNKKVAIPVFAIVVALMAPVRARTRTPLLRDGVLLGGVDGKLVAAEANEIASKGYVRFQANQVWLFKLDADLRRDKVLLKAGTSLQLLPCAGLEKMVAMSKDFKGSYRLWGRVTKYKDKNFIFAGYFVPVGKVPLQTGPAAGQARTEPVIRINEPNDVLAIPEEILNKLSARKVVQPVQLRKALQLKEDFILADRTGYIRKQPDGTYRFVLDAVGFKLERTWFELLPCQALELALQKQKAGPDPVRFKVAGIVTTYKNKSYLLLQRATRTFSHGNFGT